MTLHPGFYNSKVNEFTYDRNPESFAYIPEGQGKHYFMGGFNGGKAKNYFELVHCLDDSIKKDLEKNVIALWHDESHLNRYMLDLDETKYRILNPSYAYPEDWDLPFDEKITILNKNKMGGHDFLRKNKKSSFLKKCINLLAKLSNGEIK